MKRVIPVLKLNSEQMAAAIKAAPDQIHDPDSPYDPNDPAAVATFWKNGVVVNGGGVQAVRAALAERQSLAP